MKKLTKEKITKENAKQIDEKKCKLAKEYLLFSEKMKNYLKKHDEKIKLFKEINEKGQKLSKEVKEKVEIYNEKKLDLRKEVSNLINKFKSLAEEAKKLKLIEIDKKCNNDVIKKQKEIFADIDTIQNALKTIVDNMKTEMKTKQNELLSQEKYDNLIKKLNDLNTDLNKLKDSDKDYNDIIEIIKEENNIIKDFESFYNTINDINDQNIKDSIEKFKKCEDTHKKLGGKINNYQKIFLPKVNNLNEYIKKNDACKKEILEIYNKFKEQKIKINELLDKLLFKMKELYDETNKLKMMDIINKSKNEMKPNWEKIQEIYNKIIAKINSYFDKKKDSSPIPINNKLTVEVVSQNKQVDDKKIKEISEKINNEMKPLEEKQKELIIIWDKLKKDKIECLNYINKIAEEEDNTMNEIKGVYKNDIKNIDMQNIKDNFEKYKKFNEKYIEIHDKIKKASSKCETLVKNYNEFIDNEFNNRKKIFENANSFIKNGIGIDEKNEKIIKKSEEISGELKKFNINELNEKFNNKIQLKMKDLNSVQKTLSQLLSKK